MKSKYKDALRDCIGLIENGIMGNSADPDFDLPEELETFFEAYFTLYGRKHKLQILKETGICPWCQETYPCKCGHFVGKLFKSSKEVEEECNHD